MHHMLPFHGIAYIGYLPSGADHRAGVGVVLEAWP
jgi:GTP cyclohydrolase I